MNLCPACNTTSKVGAHYCGNCGYKFENLNNNPNHPTVVNTINNMAVTHHAKLTATVLALLLGSFGVHKFYLKRPRQGALYLIFCWTFIPTIVSIMEGIRYICLSSNHFAIAYPLDND